MQWESKVEDIVRAVGELIEDNHQRAVKEFNYSKKRLTSFEPMPRN